MTLKTFYILIHVCFICIFYNSINAQSPFPMRTEIQVTPKVALVGITNHIKIHSICGDAIDITSLKVTAINDSGDEYPLSVNEQYGHFNIIPNSTGVLILRIEMSDTVMKKEIYAKPIRPVGRFGPYRANSQEKIIASIFKAQAGIEASIECCDIVGRCKILGYELIRIDNYGSVKRSANEGSNLSEESSNILVQAESGDIYIFRSIKYKCPGDLEPQTLDDMVYEIE